MIKKAAILLAIAMLVIVAWGLIFEAGSTRIIVNGQELAGPLKGTIGAAGLVIGLIALFCAAIFLLFVFAGIGIFILGAVILAGLVLAGLAFPLLLVMLLPLAIVWLFIAITRKTVT
ncbi:MAG TPA: hypothetical protein VMJ33_07175 [Gallionella sp.]|nr:hypothetical protein [Gallionella sp.]